MQIKMGTDILIKGPQRLHEMFTFFAGNLLILVYFDPICASFSSKDGRCTLGTSEDLLKIFQSLKGGDLKVSADKNRDRHSYRGTSKTADMNCLMNIEYVDNIGERQGDI